MRKNAAYGGSISALVWLAKDDTLIYVCLIIIVGLIIGELVIGLLSESLKLRRPVDAQDTPPKHKTARAKARRRKAQAPKRRVRGRRISHPDGADTPDSDLPGNE